MRTLARISVRKPLLANRRTQGRFALAKFEELGLHIGGSQIRKHFVPVGTAVLQNPMSSLQAGIVWLRK